MADGPLAVRIEAPAKVNLRLRVLERLASGFHSLETVFCAVSLADRLRLRRGPAGVRLVVSGVDDLGPPERNLVHRAASLYLSTTGRVDGVDIALEKRIPAAAGLGGGSSDAAATLRAMSVLFPVGMADDALLGLGAELGSDVPFFLSGSPLALAWGRGERLLALPPLPSRPILIAHPGAAIPTPEAFARLAAARAPEHRPDAFRFPLASLGSWRGLAELASNDFESEALELVPRIRPALDGLRRCGAAPALVSGSGGAIFGLFESVERRAAADQELRALGFRTWFADTLESLPEPQVDPFRTPD